jgi:catechol 2,3-dioxygenase-like lactoylglutathione lyase family enzyme
MSTMEVGSRESIGTAGSDPVDLKLEVVVIPVADADRSKPFYSDLGWRLDADLSFDNGFRVAQSTPPGSQCSVQFGTKITGAPPESAHGLYLIVSDVQAGRGELMNQGAKVNEVFHAGAPGAQLNPESTNASVAHGEHEKRIGKADPDWPDWYATFVVAEQAGEEPPS